MAEFPRQLASEELENNRVNYFVGNMNVMAIYILSEIGIIPL